MRFWARVEAHCRKAPLLSGAQAAPAVADSEWGTYVAAIIAVERTVHAFQPASGLFKTSIETSFYLSNRPIGAEQAAAAIRGHWGIENRSHYVRDITLCEDASRIRKNPASSPEFAASLTIF